MKAAELASAAVVAANKKSLLLPPPTMFSSSSHLSRSNADVEVVAGAEAEEAAAVANEQHRGR